MTAHELITWILYTDQVRCAQLNENLKAIDARVQALERAVQSLPQGIGPEGESHYYHDIVVKIMQSLRTVVDETELMVSSKAWPYPGYGELLFGVR